MYCVECGTRNPDEAKFCKRCGRRMEPPEAAQAPDAPQVTQVHAPAAVHDPEARYKELLALAFRHYDNAEYDAAAIACNGALEIRPDGTDAHALLSTIYERQGDREKAIAEREKVLQLNPASIADREKLEALRSGIAQVAPRKILSVRRPEPTFWDTPAGAAVAAVAVTLVVVVVGYAITLYRERSARIPPAIQPGTVAGSVPYQPAPQNPMPPMAGQPSVSQPQPRQSFVQNQQQPAMVPQQPSTGAMTPGSMVEPLPIRPTPPPLGQDTRTPNQGSQDGGFFDPSRSERGGSGSGSSASQSPPPPQPNPGRIEIVVSPQGSGSGTASPPSNPAPGGSSADSRHHATLAMDLQLKGDYRRAAQSWERALEGAGDDRPGIHQKAAICYQRTGDMANARRHYNEAIKGYQDQIAMGRNVEAATQAIKACQAGLAASR